MIRNCFNYIGSKDRLFSSIDRNLDKSKEVLVDVFCGSGVVGVNEVKNYSRVILNDACWQMEKTLKYFRDNTKEFLIKEIEDTINLYKLSKENKEGYLKLRESYNELYSSSKNFNPIFFYCLLTHSFNYNIHINSSGGFSVPFGANRSYFSNTLRSKFCAFQEELSKNRDKVFVKGLDFKDLFSKSEKILKNSVFYCDPPYLSSDSSYGRIHYLGKWNQEKEKSLYLCLDRVNEKGGSFLLSNVLENNGRINDILSEWSKKYNVIDVSSDFSNCNYQRKNAGETKEVLVRNY